MTDSNAEFRFDDKMNYDFHAPRRVRVELGSALRTTEEHEFVRALAEVPVAFRFKHTLMQEAAYSTLTRHERRRLHGITAHILEDAAGDALDELSAELARHYAAAGDDGKTLEYAARAAEHYRSGFTLPEARVHYAQALDALERLPTSVENRRLKIDLWLRFLELRWPGGTAERDLAFLDELEEATRALLAEDAADGVDRLRLARIHSARGGMYFMANQIPLAMQTYRQILDEAQDLGDEELLATPSLVIGAALVVQGFFAQALPLVTRTWGMWKDRPERWEWVSLIYLTTALANLGRIQEAREQIEGALPSSDLPSSSRAVTFLNMSLATIAQVERSPGAMLEYSRRAVQSSRTDDDPLDLYLALAHQALAESYLGQFDAAQSHMQESQQLLQRLGGQVIYSDWVAAFWAEIALQQGDLEQAVTLAETAWNHARSTDGWYAQGLAQRTWASALARSQPANPAVAIEHMQASLAAFERCEAPVEREWTGAALARLHKNK